jgi:misacylated tRNA(Ala) deacylase
MTELLYHSDSYIQNFTTKIIGIESEFHGIILEKTAFYPGGGGQPWDEGKLVWGSNTCKVLRAKKVGDSVVHLISEDEGLPPVGAEITGQIDWVRRFQLMRTHTAMHILCGVVFHRYGALVTGGDMDPLKGRMDFEFETMHKELVVDIEQAVNEEVKKALPVVVKILPREEAFRIPDLIRTKINLLPEGISQVRVVEIVGLDLQADGGTHVNNTAEVGQIRVVDYKSKGKINKRIYVELPA